MKNLFTNLLNSLGLYTSTQYISRVEEIDDMKQYANALERAVNDMTDPTKAILVFGSHVNIYNVVLDRNRQIIVSPRSRFVDISNVRIG